MFAVAVRRLAPVTPATAAAVEDPIKKIFVEKLRAYQKSKPKGESLKRVVEAISKTIPK